MPETYRFAYGSWRKAKQIYIKNGGVWRDCKEVWVKSGGVWRKVFQKGFEFTTNANGMNFDVKVAALQAGWDGVTPLLANLTVTTVLGSVSNNMAAFDTNLLPAGSQVTLTINPGAKLIGAGGGGGYGGLQINNGHNNYQPTTNGQPGGPAIQALAPMTIINNGIIGGGGGGGAGGPGAPASINQGYDDPGSGGGGGAGSVPGAGGGSWRAAYAGQPGTDLAGGVPGALSNQGSKEWYQAMPGGAGGALGQPGGRDAVSAYQGGAAGLALYGAGNVSWQVYGDVRGPVA